MRLRVLTASIIFGAVLASVGPQPAVAEGRRAGGEPFIVRLSSPPVASYQGGTDGIPATSPGATGRPNLALRSSAVRRYAAYLDGRQSQALARLSGPAPDVQYDYRLAFPGFAAELTAAQAAQLRRAPEVAAVTPSTDDVLDSADDDLGGSNPLAPGLGGDGAAWLRLTAPTVGENATTGIAGSGLWNRAGGGPTAADGPGAGTVIGDLDTGLSGGHPSFAADPGAGLYLGAPFGAKPTTFTGPCDRGTDLTRFPACTTKVVGARFFGVALDTAVGVVAAEKPFSPRDGDGHGSHTASTAVGNYGVQAGPGPGVARISGIAPRARLAVYKVCWHTADQNGDGLEESLCNSADVIAGIEAGVADGVDVLTHSIGGGVAAGSPKQLAFLGAYDAGVFVAVSAGNSGPSLSTYGATPSPWTEVVAASTINRTFTGTLTLTGGALATPTTITGVAASGGIPAAAAVVDGAAIPAAGSNATDSGLCATGALSAALAAGKIVLCARGGDRLAKGAAVKAAGGVGMVLGNVSATGTQSNLPADAHGVASIHVLSADFTTIKNAVAAAPPGTPVTATLASKRDGTVDVATPRIASFSSRGPVSTAIDLPGPDVTGPGVDILAAGKGDATFLIISGTSMSTPHVAGAALLLAQRHPLWNPEQLRSALDTTADPNVKVETGSALASPLLVGSGQIDPNRADDPGLVVTPSRASLAGYLESPDETAGDLNLPAIVSYDMGGSDRVVRRFASVDTVAHTWTVSAVAPDQTSLTTDPAVGQSFTVGPCASADVAVNLAMTGGSVNVARFGELKLTDEAGRTVRVPITVRPTTIGAPDVALARTQTQSASRALSVSTANAGPYAAVSQGLAAPTASRPTVLKASTTVNPVSDTNALRIGLDVAFGSGVSAALIAADVRNPSVADGDVDLFLYTADAGGNPVSQVAAAANSGPEETLRSVRTTAGKYVLIVQAFSAPAGGVSFDLRTWNTGAVGGPSLTVTGAPNPTTSAQRFDLGLAATGLAADGEYLGLVSHYVNAAGTGTPTTNTIVRVVRGAAPPAPPAERSPALCPAQPDPTNPPTTTTSTSATPTPTPAAPGSGTPTPGGGAGKAQQPDRSGSRKPPALAAAKLSIRGRRTITITLQGSEPVTVSLSVKARKAKKAAASARAQKVTTTPKKLRFKLSKKLKRGRFVVTFKVKAVDGRKATVSLPLKVT